MIRSKHAVAAIWLFLALTPIGLTASPAGSGILAPDGLAAAPAGSGMLTLSWNCASGATSYVLSRSSVSSGPYTMVAGNIHRMSYTDSGLIDGTPYYYVVASENLGGTSGYSNEAEGISRPLAAIPSPPSSLTATPSDGQVALSWPAVGGATSYTLYRCLGSGGPYATVSASQSATTYTDTGLTDYQPYYYVVTASNEGGESQYSAEVRAVPYALPTVPTHLTAAQAVQAAATFCTTVGATSYPVGTPRFPAPRLEGLPQNSYFPNVWQIDFGGLVQVDVDDATGEVIHLRDHGLENELSMNPTVNTTPLDEATALTDATAYVTATGQTETLDSATGYLQQMDTPVTADSIWWQFTWPRQFDGIDYHDQGVNVMVQAATGQLECLSVAFSTPAPSSGPGSVTSSEASATGLALLQAEGYADAASESNQLLVVEPNQFWALPAGQQACTAPVTVAWVCVYIIDGGRAEVWMDSTSDDVAGGLTEIVNGTSRNPVHSANAQPKPSDPTPGQTAVTAAAGRTGKNKADGSVAHVLAAANVAFAFDLLKKLSHETPTRNCLFSPLGISQALQMALTGAEGRTRNALAAGLSLGGMPDEALNAANRSLLQGIRHIDPRIHLAVANALWSDTAHPLAPAYRAKCARDYDARADTLRLSDPRSAATINRWVRHQTHGAISSIVSPSDLTDSAAVLTDAVSFHGPWTTPFDVSQTMTSEFTSSAGVRTPAEMMEGMIRLDYYEDARLQAVRIPYADVRIAMYVLLPREVNGIAPLISEITPEEWRQLRTDMRPEKVAFLIPRMNVRQSATLNEALKTLGMAEAFGPGADFRQMGPSEERIGTVRQAANMQVDEKGTTAAAAAVVAIPAGVGGHQDFVQMTIDHPFLCAIRDDATGTLLFLGAIRNPAKSLRTPGSSPPVNNMDFKGYTEPSAPLDFSLP